MTFKLWVYFFSMLEFFLLQLFAPVHRPDITYRIKRRAKAQRGRVCQNLLVLVSPLRHNKFRSLFGDPSHQKGCLIIEFPNDLIICLSNIYTC